jgi:hypothetical protein
MRRNDELSPVNATRLASDGFLTARPEISGHPFRGSAISGESELQPEEHVLFVLHPAWTEKGDLL